MNSRALKIAGVSLGFALLLAAYGAIGIAIRAERQRQADLEQQIAPIQTAVALQREGGAVLPTRQAELATLQAQREEFQFAIPSEVDSTEVLAHIVATAAAQGVNLRRLEARDPFTVTVGSRAYWVLGYAVQVEGDLAAVSAFLTALESGPIGTLVLDQVQVEARPTPTSTPPSASSNTPVPPPPPYRATLIVQVYTRETGPEGSSVLPPTLSPQERTRQLERLVDEARQQGDWTRVISLLLVLRSDRPDDPDLEAQLVEAYVRDGQRRMLAGQFELAEAAFRAALEIDPENEAALEGLDRLETLRPTPTSTPTPALAAATPTTAATPTLPYYVLRLSFEPNDRYPHLGCNWFGFVGQVTDADGYPVPGVTVRIWASEWEGVQTTTGAGGEYEQFLDDHPRAERWMVQLYEGGTPVSPAVAVESRASCDAAVIQMDWRRGY